ncbi:MAG: hypothetical protein IKO87_02005 [Kiritimatiellae bacterium]|nr:hypothetical protein [Kiritimatiellia bacterium]
MSSSETKWFLRTQDETFGPETEEKLVEWARMGRIQPGQEISEDNIAWRRVEDVPFLDMRFSIDLGDGNPRGPFNKAAAEALLASGRLPPTATLVEVREPFPEPEAAPTEESESEPILEPEQVPAPEPVQPRVIEKVVVKEVRVEVPVEKTVIKEVRVEVPVEVEKIVVDETRVKELEKLLDDANRETAKLKEQVVALSDELRRLPQAASEVADIQAAMFTAMTSEAEELQKLLEDEKRDAEEFRKRHQERADKLLERRRNLLKRAGANIEEMTRKALIERPEDPRTAQLRRELEDLRRVSERKAFDYEDRIRGLTEKLKVRETELSRATAGMKDVTQLQAEVQALKEQVQLREKDLMAERQKGEEMRQQQAFAQQAMMARLAQLESPSIGTVQSLSTNQSREAKLVKLPRWMKIGS